MLKKLPVLHESANLRYITFFNLYIMQGVPAGFALTTIANYLVGRGVGSERVGAFIATVGLPWIGQFIWGPLIDRYQYSDMGRRKHWIVFSQWASVLVSSALIFIHDPTAQLTLLSFIFFTHSIFASIQVASVDAMAITIAPPAERGRLNAYMRGGFLIGTAIGAAGLSVLLHAYGFRFAAAAETCLLALLAILFFLTKLEKQNVLLINPFRKGRLESGIERANPSFRRVFKKVHFGITRRKSLRYFGIVAIVYFCSSVFIRSYTFNLIHELKWSDRSVSLIQGGWGSTLTFFGIIFAGIQSDRIGAKRMQVRVMWVVCAFLLLLNFWCMLWQNTYVSGSALLLWNLADPLLSVTIFPILMALCLKKVEGSQFTTYLALINLCDVLGSYVTGWSLTILPAPMLGLFCGIILLMVLLWLWKTNNDAIPDPSLNQAAALH
jgi:PAT family beta-lactamase induction signal transducer AmpG